ncbi:MAG: hypothetical protein JSV88_16855 [Candidatus Aminicenantes bacterium]|nr:MAG: hypothetical protein JSV88_16855 [Candidatus Aminicenantes bacterium]
MQKLEKKNIEDILSLTPMQEGMLFHYLEDPGSDFYFEQLSLDISGDIEIPAFEQAWNFVIETNEMLRTVFRWEKVERPMQIVLKKYKLQPRYYDCSEPGGDARDKKQVLEEIKERDRKEKFDLRDVPFRVTLCRIDRGRYEMIISNHHILYDGWSNSIIIKEFLQAYSDLSRGKIPIRPLKHKFKEFVQWVHTQDTRLQESFWRGYLEGFKSPTPLPITPKRRKTSRDVKQIEGYKMKYLPGLKSEIQHFIQENKVTFATLLYSSWGILLQKYNNTQDVVFGTTISGRPGRIKGIENIVGLFINTLPLRVQTYEKEKIPELLRRIQGDLQLREEYAGTPLVKIKEYSQVNQQQELFNSIVVIENYPLEDRLTADDYSLLVNSHSIFDITNYDLALFININEVVFYYNGGRFDEKSIETLSEHFKKMLQCIVQLPNLDILDLDILSEEEKRQILKGAGKTAPPGANSKNKTIDELKTEIAFEF